MIFLMDDPARGGHPLDVARTDDTTIAGGIAMLDFAVIDDGDRLETAMRVLANPAPLGRRREVMGAGIIEQQERTDMRAQRIVGKQRADREAIAYPMAAIIAVTAEYFLAH